MGAILGLPSAPGGHRFPAFFCFEQTEHGWEGNLLCLQSESALQLRKNAASHRSKQSNWSDLKVLCPVWSQKGHRRGVAVLSLAVLTFSFKIMITNLSVSQTLFFGDEVSYGEMYTSALVVLLMAPFFLKH